MKKQRGLLTALNCLTLFFLTFLVGCRQSKNASTDEKAIAKSTDTTHLNFTATEATDWTELFNRTTGWFGADGIFSIPLSGVDTARTSDSTMLIFSDTVVGDIENGKLKPGYRMINSSVAYMKGTIPKKENIQFYYDKNKKGEAETIFKPNTANTQKGDYYWLGDGFVNKALNGDTYIFAYRMRNMGNKEWSFKQVGNALIVLKAGSSAPFADHRQIETPFLVEQIDDSESSSLGAGLFINTKNAGVPNPDGYVYAYGVQGKAKNLIAARVLPEAFENFDSWRFWDGTSWVAEMSKAAHITNNVSNELSVSPLPDGRYALVFQVGGMGSVVGLRLGLSPYGPFGPIIKLWDCKEPQHKNYITYNAKAHPCLSGKGELLISYNVNAFDFGNEIQQNPNLYRPRFVKIRYE